MFKIANKWKKKSFKANCHSDRHRSSVNVWKKFFHRSQPRDSKSTFWFFFYMLRSYIWTFMNNLAFIWKARLLFSRFSLPLHVSSSILLFIVENRPLCTRGNCEVDSSLASFFQEQIVIAYNLSLDTSCEHENRKENDFQLY